MGELVERLSEDGEVRGLSTVEALETYRRYQSEQDEGEDVDDNA